ncbi:hypothetical protein B0A64_23445 [Flavobacterium araucananum]|jgi:hypothetical protein|uniref:Uncharacterized protein n=1 Tax=Flavobacterium araucananum TaxID=946678 RepID=A0A227NJ18_9FLAO|nr:hypothetical protein B0A64_23445 [Flavobacterium araucananum]
MIFNVETHSSASLQKNATDYKIKMIKKICENPVICGKIKKNKPALFRISAGLNKLKAKNYFCIRSSIRFLQLI